MLISLSLCFASFHSALSWAFYYLFYLFCTQFAINVMNDVNGAFNEMLLLLKLEFSPF